MHLVGFFFICWEDVCKHLGDVTRYGVVIVELQSNYFPQYISNIHTYIKHTWHIPCKILGPFVTLLTGQAARPSLPCSSSTCFQPVLWGLQFIISHRAVWYKVGNTAELAADSSSNAWLASWHLLFFLLWYLHSLPSNAFSKTRNSGLFNSCGFVVSWNNSEIRYSDHIMSLHYKIGGTRWRSWLRHCATSRKFEGSIPDGVIEIFHWHNPSGCTMALGYTQPLIEMSTRNTSWG